MKAHRGSVISPVDSKGRILMCQLGVPWETCPLSVSVIAHQHCLDSVVLCRSSLDHSIALMGTG